MKMYKRANKLLLKMTSLLSYIFSCTYLYDFAMKKSDLYEKKYRSEA